MKYKKNQHSDKPETNKVLRTDETKTDLFFLAKTTKDTSGEKHVNKFLSMSELPTLDGSFKQHFDDLDVSDANHCCSHNELLYIICIHTHDSTSFA